MLIKMDIRMDLSLLISKHYNTMYLFTVSEFLVPSSSEKFSNRSSLTREIKTQE